MPLDVSGGAGGTLVGRHAVHAGDCLTVLTGVADGSVDAIVTSPPYNIGVAYRSYDDRQPRAEYLAWLGRVSRELARVLAPGGSLFLNIGSTNTDPWLPLEAAGAFRGDFVLQNHIAWVKSLSIGDDTVGHFKPITSRRYLNHNHEQLFHFSLDGDVAIDRLAVGVPFKDKSNIARWGHARDRRCGGNVWFIPYRTVRSKAQKFDHPAGFPVALPERCLRLRGGADLTVLDPFAGAGTTLVAAHWLGHRAIGIELDPHYAATAIARLRAEGAEDGPVHDTAAPADAGAKGPVDDRAGRAVARGDLRRTRDQPRRGARKIP